MLDELVATQPTNIEALIRANIRAARARLGLTQTQVSRRMRALGFARWHQQTCALVERNQRPLLAGELAALALALETVPDQLAGPPPGVTAVMFGDLPIPAARLSVDDGSVTWDGDTPKISEGAGPVAPAVLEALRQAARLGRLTGGDIEIAPLPPEPTGEES